MKYSLLFKTREDTPAAGSTLTKTLLLDNAFKQLHTNERALRYFFEVLSAPPKHTENAEHRAKILEEFHKNPSLMDRLNVCLQTIDAIPDQFQTQRAILHTNARFGSDARYLTDEKLLMHSASTLLQMFRHLEQLLETLESYELGFGPLSELADSIRSITKNESYSLLLGRISQLSCLPADYRIELQFSLNELGRLREYDLTALETVPTPPKTPNALKMILLSREEKEALEEQIKKCSPIPEGLPTEISENDFRNMAVGGVYERMTETLNQMLSELFERYCGMSAELYFYQVAFSILTFLEKQEIPFCFAEYSASDRTEITDLRDFVLLVESYGTFPVIPNDVCFTESRRGILISGENSSGKTVYLRSIATAMLFAQSGLPIPAKTAIVNGYRSIYTLFSSAENPALAGSGAGRFEEEVAALSEIVDLLEAGDILFLNEIFQTTSYQEGALGLSAILRYLVERNVRYVCVSHLTDLFHLVSDEEAAKLSTSDPNGKTPYKLSPSVSKP